MTTTTINDLFTRYADACGSEGPTLDRDAIQDDFRDWCRSRGVEARYEEQGEAYLAADDGPHSEAATSDDARDDVDAAAVAETVTVGVQLVTREPVEEDEVQAFWVTADVDGAGHRVQAKLYACRPSDGRPGLDACGDSLEDWCDAALISAYGRDTAATLAREALAMARV